MKRIEFLLSAPSSYLMDSSYCYNSHDKDDANEAVTKQIIDATTRSQNIVEQKCNINLETGLTSTSGDVQSLIESASVSTNSSESVQCHHFLTALNKYNGTDLAGDASVELCLESNSTNTADAGCNCSDLQQRNGNTCNEPLQALKETDIPTKVSSKIEPLVELQVQVRTTNEELNSIPSHANVTTNNETPTGGREMDVAMKLHPGSVVSAETKTEGKKISNSVTEAVSEIKTPFPVKERTGFKCLESGSSAHEHEFPHSCDEAHESASELGIVQKLLPEIISSVEQLVAKECCLQDSNLIECQHCPLTVDGEPQAVKQEKDVPMEIQNVVISSVGVHGKGKNNLEDCTSHLSICQHPIHEASNVTLEGCKSVFSMKEITCTVEDGKVCDASLDVAVSDSDSSSDSTSMSSDDSFELEMRNRDVEIEEIAVLTSPEPPKVKGEISLKELPPVDELNIVLPENTELGVIGKITHIMDDHSIVIESNPGQPAVDYETVLFLSRDVAIGKVEETFGPVHNPYYIIRFNSEEHLVSKGITIGLAVYYAPKATELTTYVFLSILRQLQGSDASWCNDVEPPASCLDYSDDEKEREARKKIRNARKEENTELASNNEGDRPLKNKRGRGSGRTDHWHNQSQRVNVLGEPDAAFEGWNAAVSRMASQHPQNRPMRPVHSSRGLGSWPRFQRFPPPISGYGPNMEPLGYSTPQNIGYSGYHHPWPNPRFSQLPYGFGVPPPPPQ